MIGTRVSYLDEQQPLEGYLTAPDSARDLPGVLIVPSWLNVNESICRRADRLADAGYAAFVVDLFGAGVQPRPPQSPMEVVGPFLKDRAQFRKRLSAGVEEFRRRPECDSDRLAAIGYCIGGCGVLELARAGAPLRGVVSLHGILAAPIPAQRNAILSKSSCCTVMPTLLHLSIKFQRFETKCHLLKPTGNSISMVVRGTASRAKVFSIKQAQKQGYILNPKRVPGGRLSSFSKKSSASR